MRSTVHVLKWQLSLKCLDSFKFNLKTANATSCYSKIILIFLVAGFIRRKNIMHTAQLTEHSKNYCNDQERLFRNVFWFNLEKRK